jgi:hypothetical protein
VSQSALSFRTVPEIRRSDRRCIGFLEGHEELNASIAFEDLGIKQKRDLRAFMGEWVGGKDRPKSRFHGWPNDKECKMCFVFKAKENTRNHRFYGYLCNPLTKTNPPFRLCVLCIHSLKNERDSDRSELLRVKVWFESAAANGVIRNFFPDQPMMHQETRGKQWQM